MIIIENQTLLSRLLEDGEYDSYYGIMMLYSKVIRRRAYKVYLVSNEANTKKYFINNEEEALRYAEQLRSEFHTDIYINGKYYAGENLQIELANF